LSIPLLAAKVEVEQGWGHENGDRSE